MTSRAAAITLVAGSMFAAPIMSGCEGLPGRPREQFAIGGAVAGAVIGGIAAGTWWAGALIGGGIGLVGGWIIGWAVEEWFGWGPDGSPRVEAPVAPVTPEQALWSDTADINGDGVVSIDELLAMHYAGLTDEEIIRRLERTNCIFELSESQNAFLREHGVSERIVAILPEINQELRDQMLARMAQ